MSRLLNIGFLGLFSVSSPTYAAHPLPSCEDSRESSFECMIIESLDVSLNLIYKRTRQLLDSSQKQSLKANQLEWLKKRQEVETHNPGKEGKEKIINLYKERLFNLCQVHREILEAYIFKNIAHWHENAKESNFLASFLRFTSKSIDDIELEQSGTALIYTLSNQLFFAAVPVGCGAYQCNYLPYKIDLKEKKIIPLTIETCENGTIISSKESTFLGVINFSKFDKKVSVFQKGRGVGDCGMIGEYKIKDNQMKLIRWYEKENCDGKPMVPENLTLKCHTR
jgi:hypothetical protein